MIYARIDGNAVSTVCHPSAHGCRLLLCQQLDEEDKAIGTPFVAIDRHGAGLHSKVFVSTDGRHAQEIVGDNKSPLRNTVLGVIDD